MRKLPAMTDDDRQYLQELFSDLLNYEAEDITSPIDPLVYRNPEGDSCLHIASLRGELRAVELLLEAGLDPNARGDMGNTPLHYATTRGNSNVANCLIAGGASENITNDFGARAGG
jgi:ankyrin repeat protein